MAKANQGGGLTLADIPNGEYVVEFTMPLTAVVTVWDGDAQVTQVTEEDEQITLDPTSVVRENNASGPTVTKPVAAVLQQFADNTDWPARGSR